MTHTHQLAALSATNFAQPQPAALRNLRWRSQKIEFLHRVLPAVAPVEDLVCEDVPAVEIVVGVAAIQDQLETLLGVL